MTASTQPALRPYPMDNDLPASARQHAGLTAMLDPSTTHRIEGLIDLSGKRCLEVGAGGGSIALWMAQRVGPTGHVVATDLKPNHIPAHERMTVLKQDLTCDPMPEGPFDLAHARLVLNHRPERMQILRDLISVLAPGGLLLVEDWQADNTDTLIDAPDEEAAELYRFYQRTVGSLFATAGTDRTWARRIHPTMLREGLVDVTTQVTSVYWTGGSAEAQLNDSNLEQMEDKLLAAGMTQEQLVAMKGLLRDPRLVVAGFPLHSTCGRRPAA